jgi:CHAT domain-containing protein/tetratricopeptide (TPR) repeat protein
VLVLLLLASSPVRLPASHETCAAASSANSGLPSESTLCGAIRPHSPQNQDGTVTLEPGKPLDRHLASGKIDSFEVVLAAGEYLHVVVEQQGVNVEVAVLSPDGGKLAEMDGPFGAFGPEAVSIVSAVSGAFSIRVKSSGQTADTGNYRIEIGMHRPPTEADLSRVAAERLFMQARQMQAPGALAAAIVKYTESIPYWRQADEKYAEARTFFAIAALYDSAGKTKEAAENYARSLPLLLELGFPRSVAITRNNLGLALARSGRLTPAIDYFKSALEYWESQGERGVAANVLNNLGQTYNNLGEADEALSCQNRALEIRQRLGNKSDIAQSLNNIGLIYDRTAEWQKGIERYTEALGILRSIGTLAVEEHAREAAVLNNIGYDYALLGDTMTALDYFTEALELRKKLGRPIDEGATLANLGNVQLTMGNLEAALTFNKDALGKQNRWGGAYTLLNIGKIYHYQGDSQKALDNYQEALTRFGETGDLQGQAAASYNLGGVLAARGDAERAREQFKKAMTLWRSIHDTQGEATGLFGLARLERANGNRRQALGLIDHGIEILESNRTHLVSWELRSSYFASAYAYYGFAIDLLMDLDRQFPNEGHSVAALELAERGRARTLLDMLSSASVDIASDISPEIKDRRLALERRINSKAMYQLQQTRSKATADAKAAADKEMRGLLTEYEQLDARARGISPRYAAMTRDPATIKEIQTQLLDADTLLLDYVLGDERSFVWLVSEHSIETFELAARNTIESAARRFHDLMTAREPVGNETAPQYSKRVAAADQELPSVTAKLSEMLLGPLAGKLGRKRLIVVPEGALHLVPLCALLEPSAPDKPVENALRRRPAANSEAGTPYMVLNHEIVALPSISVLGALRREAAHHETATKQVAILANPVFDRTDARVKLAKSDQGFPARKTTTTSNLTRALRDFDLALPALPSTRREAEAIMSIVSPGQGWLATDFKASREAAVSSELKNYRVIHFATHSLIDDRHPELSGVVLSLVDEHGNPTDGFLRLHDVYSMNLPVELVVLSACRTGLGKDVRGEGVIGLTRGFMHAGARRIMTTFWSVNDLATASLMEDFYRRMLVQGQSAAAALRGAQIDALRHSAWRHPFYWAAFVLAGEYR